MFWLPVLLGRFCVGVQGRQRAWISTLKNVDLEAQSVGARRPRALQHHEGRGSRRRRDEREEEDVGEGEPGDFVRLSLHEPRAKGSANIEPAALVTTSAQVEQPTELTVLGPLTNWLSIRLVVSGALARPHSLPVDGCWWVSR